MARHGGAVPRGGGARRAPCPAPLRHGRRARAQQRARRRGVPARRRPGLHGRSEPRRAGRGRDGRGHGRDRGRLDFRAHGGRGARRALGPRLRGLRRGSAAGGGADGGEHPRPAGQPPGLGSAPGARVRKALPRRRRHGQRRGSRQRGTVGDGAPRRASGPVCGRGGGARGEHHGRRSPRERPPDAPEPPAHNRRPQGGAQVRRLRRLQLGSHRCAPRRRGGAGGERRQRRRRHGDGAAVVPGLHRDARRPGA